MTIRVGVLGAGGKVGAAVCAAVAEAEDTALISAVDPNAVGESTHGITITAEVADLVATGVDVVVDFTHLEPARLNLPPLGAAGIHAVVGTTGFDDSDLTDLAASFTSSNCLIAPNFAIGAVLMMRFAELAAPHFERAEIIELHHEQKIDAPSGTAMKTLERMAAAAPAGFGDDPTRTHTLAGARGAAHESGIHVHSVRMRGMVAHQEVLLGTDGETLTIRHDSYDRSSFMPGVMLAVRNIGDHPGVTVGLEPFLGL